MKVEDSYLNDKYIEKITMSHGTYYFFEKFIISEISAGIVFDWAFAKEVIDVANAFYGEDINISYISNRVNKYSLNPIDWIKFFKYDYALNKIAFVSYTDVGTSNILLEKIFIKTKLQKFSTLESAVDWVLDN